MSKCNFKERIRKMEDRQDRFSIRKFSIGTVSVFWNTVNSSSSCGYCYR